MTVGIRLFGTIEVTTPSRNIGVKDFPSRKAKTLCELLALAGGKHVPRARLIEEMWGDKLPRDPNAALDHTVSLLRSVLRADDGTQPLVHVAGTYRIDPALADVDIVRFDMLAHQAVGQDGHDAIATLMEAVAIAADELLADEPYAPWAAAARAHYSQRVESTLVDIARRALALDDPELACQMAERVRRSSEIVVEQAYSLNAAALIRLGRRDEARRLLGEVERRLRVDHDSDVSDETARLQSVLRHPAQVRARIDPVTVETRLRAPVAAALFVGRKNVVSRVEGDLVEAVAGRAVGPIVIEGPGGIGRSSLLEHVADRFVGAVHRFDCLSSDLGHELLAATRLSVSVADPGGVVVSTSARSLFAGIRNGFGHEVPTLLAIDDIHWADPDSVAVFASLAQHGVSVIATRCRFEVTGARAVPGERVVSLGRLSRSTIERLPIGGAWRETGGHPGVLAVCLDAHRRTDSHFRLDSESTLKILRWVGPDGSLRRDVLAVASTIEPCSIERLARALGMSSVMTSSVVDEAVDLLLVKFDSNATLRFRSDLVRRALAASATS